MNIGRRIMGQQHFPKGHTNIIIFLKGIMIEWFNT